MLTKDELEAIERILKGTIEANNSVPGANFRVELVSTKQELKVTKTHQAGFEPATP